MQARAPMSRGGRTGAAVSAVLGLALLAEPARGQRAPCSARHPLVETVEVRGNRALPADSILGIIATEGSGFWRRRFGWNVGTYTCLDSVETARDDVARIQELYDERGFPGTSVTATVERKGATRARVTFHVAERAPVRIDTVAVRGLPADAGDSVALARRIRGTPVDTIALRALADSIQLRILDAGYARAGVPVVRVTSADTVARRAAVALEFTPRNLTWIGSIDVRYADSAATPSLSRPDVLALLRVKPGDRLSAREVSATQRDLYQLGLYRSARLERAAASGDTVPLILHLAEGDRRRLRASGGWGTLDCFRTQLRFVSEHFLHSGHRLEWNARVSKIGVGEPLAGFPSLCAPRVRDDPFSRRLNYYGGVTANLRGVLGARLKPAVTVYSERRSELGAYEQLTSIGTILSVTRELGPRLGLVAQYQYADSRTEADGAVSCERFGFCRAEDLESFRVSSPIHTIGGSLAKSPLLPRDDPTRGTRWQVELRQGYTMIARTRTLNFTRVVAEGAAYHPLGPMFVLATRAQFGFVFAPQDRSYLLPPQERFYSGGQSTVRGYDQNTLGPGSYIVGSYNEDTLSDGTVVGVADPATTDRRLAPSGGNAMWIANIELRTRKGWPVDPLRWVFFADAGRVWNTNDVFSVTNAAPRVTPGIGARFFTPIGPFRVDIGYNPYALEAGPAFYVQRADLAAGIVARAICVSPGTTDPLVQPASAVPTPALCPASFVPARARGLLPRLAFQFSIGHAF